ncbi:hypothetical protein DTO006G1_5558 [Penicillium roqueforti]|uniref:uncharacterized protein n=1 Tax=Penicillium roqueforti TaxID=5082 RepID=UPI00190D2C29|nr:uncharacterized protein LCP9604111_8694 [Penicillium roqueforti]KAF9240519.1 hypothetical protein LCP9604111_8694 [Penicillium roqueforti]KAI1830787.1 hypothetical protein CBS147337_8404 [Penicillium roqueforti]KAI2674465.1 hypothetical protein CBS147355_7079 [Penicillium roqueforti]KAI2683875.1 hypothetical protein LCP963914a_5705 [Penicillium roqueforti]KAI2696809.1 hypothetical protein CBS147372_8228 [Penicillium roqueforti]
MMDLSHLTRPGILCQCARCSSSLAALENEWAKLSNAYSIPTAWLSVDLHRIAVSSERKQIPHTSDMTLLRGRVIQEVSCKLCQQRMGVLCPLDNGMNILWKMSKVAFREIVTMRTVQPVFKQGALERLICPPKEPPRRNTDLVQGNAVVPAGSTDPTTVDPAMQKQMIHQGRSIDQISNSVNHLQDTMSDLKNSFTALRIELNRPGRNLAEGSILQGQDFDMIAMVLKELKSKSDEIEKLKLEIEALKLKNRYMGVTLPHQQESLSIMNMNAALPEVRSPGLLQAGRKRNWPDAFSGDRSQTIADSPEEDDMVDEMSLSDPLIKSSRIPLNDQPQPAIINGPPGEEQLESLEGLMSAREPENISIPLQPQSNLQQTIAKRPRLGVPFEESPQTAPPQPQTVPQKRPPGRPRKSISQPTIPDLTESPSIAPSTTQGNVESNVQQNTVRRRTSRRSLRAQSLGPNNSHAHSEEDQQNTQESTEAPPEAHPAPNKKTKRNTGSPNGKRTGGPDEDGDEAAMNEKRKAKVAARDVMAKMALQHEEALEAENA